MSTSMPLFRSHCRVSKWLLGPGGIEGFEILIYILWLGWNLKSYWGTTGTYSRRHDCARWVVWLFDKLIHRGWVESSRVRMVGFSGLFCETITRPSSFDGWNSGLQKLTQKRASLDKARKIILGWASQGSKGLMMDSNTWSQPYELM
jgi:hypothetical protein